MHICFLCNEYPPGKHGGVGTMTQTLGRALISSGQSVSVVGLYRQKKLTEENDLGVKVYRVPAARIPYTGFIINGMRIRKILNNIQEKYPVDVLDGPEQSFFLISKKYPAKKVIRLHGGHHFFTIVLGEKTNFWKGWVENKSFSKADFLCAVSQYVAERTCEFLHLNQQLTIIRNPVNSEFFSTSQTSIDENEIAFFGTVCEKKGIRQLIQALPKVLTTNPKVRLLVIGRDQFDRKLKKSFTDYIMSEMSEEVLSHVTFLGAVKHDELPAILERTAICVFPSHMEAMPIAWLEGMSMGKAVIVSKTGPGPEIIEDGLNGLLCDPFDPESIAEKIILILNNTDMRKKLGENARKKVLQEFSIDVLVKKNLDFYENCLSNGY
jgi:glycosyltransferase involved in cell wall biosynthesis